MVFQKPAEYRRSLVVLRGILSVAASRLRPLFVALSLLRQLAGELETQCFLYGISLDGDGAKGVLSENEQAAARRQQLADKVQSKCIPYFCLHLAATAYKHIVETFFFRWKMIHSPRDIRAQIYC